MKSHRLFSSGVNMAGDGVFTAMGKLILAILSTAELPTMALDGPYIQI